MVVDWDRQRHRHGSCCLFIFFLISFCVTVFPTPTSADDTMVITEADLEALMAIKQSLVDPLGALKTWNSSSSLGACQNKWEGIKCAQGQVIVLQLPNKGLGGTLSSQVGQLPALRKLNLHHNRIQGSIPSTISFLTNLRGLYLNHNLFTGFIPAGLTSSPMLQSIDLSYNMLSGSIPPLAVPTLPSPKLFYLDFSYNNLSGSIPANVFASFTSLRELHLRHNHLQGPIPAAQFQKFSSLAVLDLSDNQLNGSFPAELAISSSSNFSVLDLSFNQLSGELPAAIGNLTELTVLDLSHNNFTSSVPAELSNITNLQKLDISLNEFNGTLPPSLGELKNLTFFNCSYNQLTGAVPKFVHSFNSSSYLGNVGLCGYNSVACAFRAPPNQIVSSSPSSLPNIGSPSAKKRRFSSVTFIIIVVGSIVAGLLMLCLLVAVICIMCRKKASDETYGAKSVAGKGMDKSSSQSSTGGKDGMEVGGGKLVHFDGAFTFTADGLLCATAEVLGKSTYGTVYKATFEDGNQVAVKRLREGIVKSQRDFEVEVNLLGKVRHPNLLALRGYYWGPKDEKLLIYDFMAGGSLAAFLHARGPETPLNWHTRLNIAAGAARGLLHLHSHERIIHGNLTSSNILLDSRMNAKLSDFGLARLMTTSANANVIATASALGYRAPELTKLRKASTKSDVYSFGVVLLELLTGKSPGDASSADSTAGMDLPEWVASIVKEEWTNEIFDLELMKGSAPSEDELINTLQLAMNCVTPNPGSRPTIEEVSRQLDETLNKPQQPSQHTTSSESLAAPQ